MPEALTESFCERCGTRYEFPAPAKLSTLRKTRGLVSGFKNYIMSQDALSDTIEDAMRSEEEVLAAHQLEAFHAAFNFCINCRQYACTNCWNESAGRCRTCVPIPGVDDLDDRMEAAYLADHRAMHADAVAETTGADEIARRLDVDAWPESDLPEVAATNGHEPMEWPDDSLTPAASAEVEPEPVGYAPAAELEPQPVAAEAETPAEIEPQPVAAEAEPELHPILSWEEDAEITFVPSIEEELPEPQAVWVTAEAGAEEELEPALAEAEQELETAAPHLEPELEPEPVAAEVAEEPQPVAAEVAEVAEEPQPVAAEVETPAEAEPEPVAAQDQADLRDHHPYPSRTAAPTGRRTGSHRRGCPCRSSCPAGRPGHRGSRDGPGRARAQRPPLSVERRGRQPIGARAANARRVPRPVGRVGPGGRVSAERGCRSELRELWPVAFGERPLLPSLRTTPGAIRLASVPFSPWTG